MIEPHPLARQTMHIRGLKQRTAVREIGRMLLHICQSEVIHQEHNHVGGGRDTFRIRGCHQHIIDPAPIA